MDKQPLHHSVRQNCRLGDARAFEQLYNRNYHRICRFAFYYLQDREEAEDVTAETFIKLWKHWANFKTEEKVMSFLRTTTRNACIDLLRSRKKAQARLVELKYLSTDMEEFKLAAIEGDGLGRIHETIAKLPDKTRLVVELTLEGYKCEEIAQKLNVSLQTIKNQKTAAMKVLRIALAFPRRL